MKTIIAGGRDIPFFTIADIDFLETMDITEVVCGGATGADEHGKQWAIEAGIPVKMFEADWKTHGKAAGPIRNRKMAEYADMLIAFWDGKSRGTKNMIDTAQEHGLIIHVMRI